MNAYDWRLLDSLAFERHVAQCQVEFNGRLESARPQVGAWQAVVLTIERAVKRAGLSTEFEVAAMRWQDQRP